MRNSLRIYSESVIKRFRNFKFEKSTKSIQSTLHDPEIVYFLAFTCQDNLGMFRYFILEKHNLRFMSDVSEKNQTSNVLRMI